MTLRLERIEKQHDAPGDDGVARDLVRRLAGRAEAAGSSDARDAMPPTQVLAPAVSGAGRPAVARWVQGAVGAAAAFWLLEAGQAWAVPLVLALVLAFVLAPAVRRLARAGCPSALGAALVVGALAGALALAAVLAVRPAQALLARLPAVEAGLAQLERAARQAMAPVTAAAPVAAAAATRADDADNGAPLVRAAHAAAADAGRALPARAADAAMTGAATLFLLYFLLVSEEALVARAARACRTPRGRTRLLATLRQLQGEIGAFLVTMVATCLLLGAATGTALAALRFPDAAFWGGLTGVLTILPYVGPVLVTLALLLAGAAHAGPHWQLALPAAVFLGLHFLEGNFLTPFLMGASLRLRPVFILAAVLVLGACWGMVGGFLAVPVLLAARAIGLHVPSTARATRLLLLDPRTAPRRFRRP